MGSSDFIDPYVDPDTGLLKNLLGLRVGASLEAAEADLVAIRRTELEGSWPKPTGDLVEFRAIHQFLFQDVYGWAGQLRTVDIAKSADGSGFFLPVSMIERASGFVANELESDDFLKGLGRKSLISKLAYHYDQLNYVHPFREGNGRAQRAFWDRVARDAGWYLDWTGVTGKANDLACRAGSDNQDLTLLIAMFDKIVTSR